MVVACPHPGGTAGIQGQLVQEKTSPWSEVVSTHPQATALICPPRNSQDGMRVINALGSPRA